MYGFRVDATGPPVTGTRSHCGNNELSQYFTVCWGGKATTCPTDMLLLQDYPAQSMGHLLFVIFSIGSG